MATCQSFSSIEGTLSSPSTDISATGSPTSDIRRRSAKKLARSKQKFITKATHKSDDFSCQSVATVLSEAEDTAQIGRAAFNVSENNATSGSRCTRSGCRGNDACSKRGKCQPKTASNSGPDAANLMACCVQNTVNQAKQMYVKDSDCQRDNPYAALGTDTFKKLLKKHKRAPRPGKKNRRAKNWCKPKNDECESIQLQLCPNLGAGHNHEGLIKEITPLLLRAAQNLDCQLKELCRRLFFMKQNVPQMTAPALVNFHAILAEIAKMLIADFNSFPTGLKLPNK